MTLVELKDEIERLIARTPYTKEELLVMFQKEQECEWTADEIFAYGIAVDYLKTKKQDASKMQSMYEKKKRELVHYYNDLRP